MPSLLAAPNLLSFSRILVAPIIYALVVSGGRYGFVIAADTEITIGDVVRVQGHKLLMPTGHDSLDLPSFCIAYAGDVGYA